MKTLKLKHTSATPYVVKSTKDFNMFSYLDSNREPSAIHVRNIMKSMSKRILFAPIYVNEKFDVIDGQHRLKALTQLINAGEIGAEINYIELSGQNYDNNAVALYNTNATNWNIGNFVKSHAKRGNINVQRIEVFEDYVRNNYPSDKGRVVYGHILYLLTGSEKASPVKEGTVVVTEENLADAMKMWNHLSDFYNAGVEIWNSNQFVKAFYKLYTKRDYVHSVMMSVMNKYYISKYLVRAEKLGDYIENLELMYNEALKKHK